MGSSGEEEKRARNRYTECDTLCRKFGPPSKKQKSFVQVTTSAALTLVFYRTGEGL